MLYGSYSATVDPKGRLKLPAAIRPDLDQTFGPDFYVTSLDQGKSVRIYPMPVWKTIADKLAEPPAFAPSKKKFLDQSTYWGQVVRIDGQGRILIPSKLREPAAMRGEVAVLGQVDKIVVWNEERLREHVKAEAITDQDWENLGNLGI